MSKRTRIGRKIDAQRVAQLVSMPGIDPRIWVSLCIVDKVVVDKDHGVFADVHVMSTATVDDDGNVVAQQETVRVAADYAGNGFGLYLPPLVGDEVLVVWPDGNPDHGGVLVKRMWSASDPPPQKAVDKPADALLMIQKDVNLRIMTQGQGNIVLQVDQGKVLLGNEQGGKPVHRQTDPVDLGTWLFTPAAGPGVASGGTLVVIPPGGSTASAVTIPPAGVNVQGTAINGSGNVSST